MPWPLKKAYFWQTAPFFRVMLPLATGICCYSLFYEKWKWLSLNVTLILFIISLIVYTVTVLIRKANQYVAFFSLQFILLLAGWLLCYFYDIRNDNAWFGNHLSNNNSYVVRISDAPKEKESTWKIPVSVLNVIQDNKANPATGNAFIYVYKDWQSVDFQKGDTLIIRGNWQPIKNPGNPFEFDYAHYCALNNLFYQQFLSVKNIKLYRKAAPKDISFIERSHYWCMQQLDRYIPDKETKGLIQAMLLGDEVNLDEHILRSYSETGIVHVIAISGSNVTFFFAIISALLWWLRNKKHLWIKYVIALPLIWFYVVMAGAPPSAIRAAAMFSLLALGFISQKNNNSLNQLFATAVILLIAQPMWLFSLGFQLSFVAVLSLILFYRPVYRLLAPTHKITKALWATIVASIAAEILVAPLVIYYFHLFPLLFIVANVAAYLFMGMVLVLGMLIIVTSFIPAIATFFALITTWLVTAFDKIISWLQNINPSSFHYLLLKRFELVLVYIIIGGLAVYLLRKKKTGLLTGLSAACLLMLSFCNNERIALQQKKLVIFNLSSTRAELIEGKEFSVLQTDSNLSPEKKDYVIKPAHTGWRTLQEKTTAHNELLNIGNKKVLFLNEPISYYTNSQFPVDYLVINYSPKKPNPQYLKEIFSPRQIILGADNTRKDIDKWASACQKAQINIYSITRDGAFVLDGFSH